MIEPIIGLETNGCKTVALKKKNSTCYHTISAPTAKVDEFASQMDKIEKKRAVKDIIAFAIPTAIGLVTALITKKKWDPVLTGMGGLFAGTFAACGMDLHTDHKLKQLSNNFYEENSKKA